MRFKEFTSEKRNGELEDQGRYSVGGMTVIHLAIDFVQCFTLLKLTIQHITIYEIFSHILNSGFGMISMYTLL